jgi:NAD(P)H-flavin reductase
MSALAQPEVKTAQVLSVTPLTGRVRLLRLMCPGGLSFSPGQYVGLARPGDSSSYHYFTIASGPQRGGEEFELCVGQGTTDFSRDLSLGDQLSLMGPLGEVLAPRYGVRTALLVATGTGIALIRAGLQAELWGARRTVAVVGNRQEGDMLFHDELSATPGLDYRPILSQPGPRWTGLVGRVQEVVDQIILEADGMDLDAVVCGQKLMVDAVVERLRRAQVPSEGIFAQGF